MFVLFCLTGAAASILFLYACYLYAQCLYFEILIDKQHAETL
jgi:hypothetical protein